MKKSLIKQFEYEHWANKTTIDAIKQSTDPDERVFKLISHIIAAHHIWISRITNEKPNMGSWDLLTLNECEDLSAKNLSSWSNYISNASGEELERELSFKFYDKESTMTVGEMITHLINHSSYHRGQIIAQLKGKLEALPLTTFIAFAKKEKV